MNVVWRTFKTCFCLMLSPCWSLATHCVLHVFNIRRSQIFPLIAKTFDCCSWNCWVRKCFSVLSYSPLIKLSAIPLSIVFLFPCFACSCMCLCKRNWNEIFFRFPYCSKQNYVSLAMCNKTSINSPLFLFTLFSGFLRNSLKIFLEIRKRWERNDFFHNFFSWNETEQKMNEIIFADLLQQEWVCK